MNLQGGPENLWRREKKEVWRMTDDNVLSAYDELGRD